MSVMSELAIRASNKDFKVRDKVRTIKDCNGVGVGVEGRVVDVYPSRDMVDVKFEDGEGMGWLCLFDEVELIV